MTEADSRFEDWNDPTVAADMVLAATSWHWIDPERGYANAAAHLRPQGTLALGWTALVGFRPQEFGEQLDQVWADALGTEHVPTRCPGEQMWNDAIASSGPFHNVRRRAFDFERSLDAATLAATQATNSVADRRPSPSALVGSPARGGALGQ